MPRRKKKTRRARALVTGYIEKIDRRVFSDFPKLLTDLVGKQHGIYALYKDKELYYVGLASNLRNRIKQHLKDRHAPNWDKFSLYLVRKADHIKELESVIMRVSHPAGNTARGRLPRAENIRSDLLKRIKEEQKRDRDSLVGLRPAKKSKPKRRKWARRKAAKGGPALAPYINKGFTIRGKVNGEIVRATVYSSGTIRFKGVLYNSPSSAAIAARKGHLTNGWLFWKYKVGKGEWARLNKLRRKKVK